MSLQSYAQGLSGLVVGYMLNETSGTVLTDFGPNNLPATLGSRGALGGSAILPEAGQSVTASGLVGAGPVATRAVAGGSPLQTSTITVVGFVVPSTATPPAGTRGLLGERGNTWSARWNTLGQMIVYVWLGGVATLLGTSITGLGAGKRYMVWFTYNGTWGTLGVNGGIEARSYIPGTIDTNTNALTIGTASNNAFDGTMQAFMVYNRALTMGELRSLMREGDVTLDRMTANNEGAQSDFIQDNVSVVATAPQNHICSVCGGLMRSNERSVFVGNTTYHSDCHAISLTPPPVITASSTQADYAARVATLTHDVLQMLSRRPSTEKTLWHDGTRWRGSATDPVSHYATANTIGAGLLAATLARFLNAPEDSWLIEVAKASAAQAFSYENVDPTFWGNGDFTFSALGKLLVMLKGKINSTQFDDWAARFVTATQNFKNGGLDSVGGSHGNEATWYTNGNREIGELTAYWCAYKLTNSSAWQTAYENQLTWLVGPTAGGFSPGGTLPFGWVEEVAPTNPDGRDGKGWFRESHGSSINGFKQVNNESIDVDGRDWGYTSLQLQYMLHLWLLNGDSRLLRYCNMMNNKLDERVNTTTWSVDGSAGSRTTANFPWVFASKHALAWRAVRPDITTTTLASQFNAMETQVRNTARGPTESFYRNIGMDLSSYILAMDAWPGH